MQPTRQLVQHQSRCTKTLCNLISRCNWPCSRTCLTSRRHRWMIEYHQCRNRSRSAKQSHRCSYKSCRYSKDTRSPTRQQPDLMHITGLATYRQLRCAIADQICRGICCRVQVVTTSLRLVIAFAASSIGSWDIRQCRARGSSSYGPYLRLIQCRKMRYNQVWSYNP